MEESEWLATTNPTAMLEDVCLTSERKLRLFCVACCRRVWEHLPGHGSRRAVRVAERYADGSADAAELDAAREADEPHASPGHGPVRVAYHAAKPSPDAASCVLHASLLRADSASPPGSASDAGWDEADAAESAAQAALLRDVFGNPFRPVTFEAAWRTPAAVALASQMYESRDFSAMPILADALQEAGCEDEQILQHCRGGGLHVRGCWVVDLVLGKD